MESRIYPQLFAAISATSIYISSGFQYGWSSPSLPILLSKNSDLHLTSDQGSWTVSIMTFGCMFGPFLARTIVDRLGRKMSLLLTAIPLLLSCALLATARNHVWLYIARFIGGLGSGGTFAIGPMYLGEIADDRVRGTLASLMATMLSLGILLTYSIGPMVDRITLAAIASLGPLFFVSTFVWVPESPYYHVMRNRQKEAEKSLIWLRGRRDVKEEIAKITRNVEFDRMNRSSFRELVTGPGNRRALLIILSLLSFQQFSGFIAIMAYSSLIFDASGSTFSTNFSLIIIALTKLCFSLVCVICTDRIGRRPLLILSSIFTTLFLIGEAIYFHLQALNVDVSAIFWLPVTCIVGFMMSYSIGLGSLCNTILSEIFPCNVKAIAAMVATTWSVFSGMVVAKLYQIIADAYGIHAAFWFFATSTFLSTIFIFIMVPETKGRSLRDIQDELLNDPREVEVLEQLRKDSPT